MWSKLKGLAGMNGKSEGKAADAQEIGGSDAFLEKLMGGLEGGRLSRLTVANVGVQFNVPSLRLVGRW
jgi:hypothetical protein